MWIVSSCLLRPKTIQSKQQFALITLYILLNKIVALDAAVSIHSTHLNISNSILVVQFCWSFHLHFICLLNVRIRARSLLNKHSIDFDSLSPLSTLVLSVSLESFRITCRASISNLHSSASPLPANRWNSCAKRQSRCQFLSFFFYSTIQLE